jgi:hypothetical protein
MSIQTVEEMTAPLVLQDDGGPIIAKLIIEGKRMILLDRFLKLIKFSS